MYVYSWVNDGTCDSTYSLMVLARAGDSALGFLLSVASLSRLWDFWAERKILTPAVLDVAMGERWVP